MYYTLTVGRSSLNIWVTVVNSNVDSGGVTYYINEMIVVLVVVVEYCGGGGDRCILL